MLDKKLQEWRNHQQCIRRVQLAKMNAIQTFPCLFVLENISFVPVYLKIRDKEKCIQLISRKRRRGLKPATYGEIHLNSLRGYERENAVITLTTKEEGEQEEVPEEEVEEEQAEVQEEVQEGVQQELQHVEEIQEDPIRLHFTQPDVLDAAYMAIVEFAKEKVPLPTPSTSLSSENTSTDSADN